MGELMRQGKVRYFGVSNYRAWRVAEICNICDDLGIARPVVSQPYYNAMNRMPEVEHFPACHYYGLGIVPYSPLARGVLTGKYAPDAAPDKDSRAGRNDKRMMQTEWRPESLKLAQEIRAHAEARGITAGQFAVSWVLNSSFVSGVIAGPRTEEQWDDYLRALDYRFTAEDEALIDRLVTSGHPSTPGFNDPAYPIEGRRARTGWGTARAANGAENPYNYRLPARKGCGINAGRNCEERVHGSQGTRRHRAADTRRLSAVTARGPYGSVKIGNWSGGAFTNDTTGAFTGCVASAPYKSGITVVVMVSRRHLESRLCHTATGRSNPATSISDRSHLRRPRTVQRQRPGHFRPFGQHRHARHVGPDQAIQGVDDDERVRRGQSVPVQSRQDRHSAAGAGQLRRDRQARRHCRRQGLRAAAAGAGHRARRALAANAAAA